MEYTSYWNSNKERLVNAALDAYQNVTCNVSSSSAGFDILRYFERNAVCIKPEYSTIASKMLFDWDGNEKYIFLRLAKMGALMFKSE
jgi:hypothetical protein